MTRTTFRTGDLVSNGRARGMVLWSSPAPDRSQVGVFDAADVGLVMVPPEGEWLLIMCNDMMGWIKGIHLAIVT